MKTQLVNDVKIQKVKIPNELLELPPLEKPFANNELDILNSYSLLFYHYKRCEINLNKIKELNNN